MASSSVSSAALTVADQFLPLNGPIMVAINLTWLLYGCFLVQIYNYYSLNSAKDHWLKFLVGAAGLAVTLHVGLASVEEWQFLVKHWGDADIWINVPWESGILSFTNALNGIFVQFFFAFRISAFSRHILARSSVGIIYFTAVLAFSGAIAIAVVTLREGTNAINIGILLETTILIWSVSTVICDVMIAMTMIIILWHARSQTSVKRMQSVLTQLILKSIETGTVTAVNILMYWIFYTAFKSTTMYSISAFVSGPLYGNVLLFVLNSRHRNRAELRGESFSFSGVPQHLSRDVPAASSSGKVTAESDILAQYNAYATEIELSEMGSYNRSCSKTGVASRG